MKGKTIAALAIITILSFTAITSVFAQAGGPPPGGGTGSSGSSGSSGATGASGAPIDGGAIILLVAVAAMGYKKKKEIEQTQGI